jgi:hypothetical protein
MFGFFLYKLLKIFVVIIDISSDYIFFCNVSKNKRHDYGLKPSETLSLKFCNAVTLQTGLYTTELVTAARPTIMY